MRFSILSAVGLAVFICAWNPPLWTIVGWLAAFFAITFAWAFVARIIKRVNGDVA